ncbi:60S acidic ribosomal protein P2B [Capsicum annuum]|nr:60S acidic ribosomal protein P2B [Capsicum annuum]
MKVIAAYLLAVLGGNASPSAKDLKNILGCVVKSWRCLKQIICSSAACTANYVYLAIVGAEADDDRIQLLLSQVEGKDITELIAAGREKLASVPAGGGGAVAVAAPAGGTAAVASAEEKKEEKKEEKEESDDDMGFSLFD